MRIYDAEKGEMGFEGGSTYKWRGAHTIYPRGTRASTFEGLVLFASMTWRPSLDACRCSFLPEGAHGRLRGKDVWLACCRLTPERRKHQDTHLQQQ